MLMPGMDVPVMEALLFWFTVSSFSLLKRYSDYSGEMRLVELFLADGQEWHYRSTGSKFLMWENHMLGLSHRPVYEPK